MANLPSPELIATRKRAVARYVAGAETRELAELYGVSSNTIRRWLELSGTPVRPQRRIPRSAIEKARKMIAEGASRSEAARSVGCSEKGLKLHGLPGWTAEQISAHVSLIKSPAYRQLGLRLTA